MSFLALLEPEIPYPLYVTGKNNVDVLLALMVAVVDFPLCMDVVEEMVVRMVTFLNKRLTVLSGSPAFLPTQTKTKGLKVIAMGR